MKLKWVFINQYKNLQKGKIQFSKSNSNVYALVGKNGSGKSNLLEAISLIFSSLYRDPSSPPFVYGICYEINNRTVEIEWQPFDLQIKVNNEEKRINFLRSNDLLPNRVIAVYSGEELRMWEQIYKPFYDEYIEDIINGKSSTSTLKLYYVNKYHWHIALLTLALSETATCVDFMDEMGYRIETIDFTFDENKIKDNAEPSLEKLLDPLKKQSRYTIGELRSLFKSVIYEEDSDFLQLNDYDVFEYLLKGNIPKNFKTITDIKLNLAGDITLKELSEGEKKKILIFTVIQVLSSQNSIILLDEPDSFLHPSWQKSLTKYIESLAGDNFVLLTTHSPNVLSGTDNDNVIRIQDGKVLENTPPTWGRDINSIQSEIMGEHFRDDETEKELQAIYDLINRDDLDAAEEELLKLIDIKLGPNDSEVIKIRTMIEFEREFR